MSFGNPIVGGTTLVRPAIHSPNYVAAVSGWSINKDGSAEFTTILIRGTGTGDTVVIGPATGPQVVIGNSGSAGYIKLPTHGAKENFVSQLVSAIGNAGLANEFEVLAISGPSTTGATDRVVYSMSSQNDNATSDANAQWLINQAGVSSVLMSLDKTIGLTVNRDVSLRPIGVAAGERYFDINAPVGFDDTSILFGLLANNTNRFRVMATGKTDVFNRDVNATGLSVDNGLGHAAHLLDLNVNTVTKAFVNKDGASSVSNMDSGLIGLTTTAGTWVEVAVVFNKTFASNPVVTASPNNQGPAVGGTTTLEVAVTQITTVGCTIRVLRSTISTMTIGWIAHLSV